MKIDIKKVERGTTIQEKKKKKEGRTEFITQTKVRPDNPWTGIGCDVGWVSPVPSCPYSLFPHAHSIPSSRRAKLWNAPTAISRTFSRPSTRTGVDICFLRKTNIMHKQNLVISQNRRYNKLTYKVRPKHQKKKKKIHLEAEESSTDKQRQEKYISPGGHGCPQVHTCPSRVSTTECVPPAATWYAINRSMIIH